MNSNRLVMSRQQKKGNGYNKPRNASNSNFLLRTSFLRKQEAVMAQEHVKLQYFSYDTVLKKRVVVRKGREQQCHGRGQAIDVW